MTEIHYKNWLIQYEADGDWGNWHPKWVISRTNANGEFFYREFEGWSLAFKGNKQAEAWALNSAKNYIDAICDETARTKGLLTTK